MQKDHTNMEVSAMIKNLEATIQAQDRNNRRRILNRAAASKGLDFHPLRKMSSGFGKGLGFHAELGDSQKATPNTECPASLFPGSLEDLNSFNKGRISDLSAWFNDDFDIDPRTDQDIKIWRDKLFLFVTGELPESL